MPPAVDLTGFHPPGSKLTARRPAPRPAYAKDAKSLWWACDCECGTTDFLVRAGQFRAGQYKSCGCGKRSARSRLSRVRNMSRLERPPPGSFPAELVAARLAQGLSRRDLAGAAGMKYSTLGQVEVGRFGLGLKTFVKLADALGWLDVEFARMTRLAAAYPWLSRSAYSRGDRPPTGGPSSAASGDTSAA